MSPMTAIVIGTMLSVALGMGALWGIHWILYRRHRRKRYKEVMDYIDSLCARAGVGENDGD